MLDCIFAVEYLFGDSKKGASRTLSFKETERWQHHDLNRAGDSSLGKASNLKMEPMSLSSKEMAISCCTL